MKKQIAQLTGLEESVVGTILEIVASTEPSTALEARRIVVSKYATPEQKENARKVWERESLMAIEVAVDYKQAEQVLQGCDYHNEKVVKLAVEKAIRMAKDLGELSWILHYLKSDASFGCVYSMPTKLSERCQSDVRDAMLERIADIATSIRCWGNFKGTADEKFLLGKMQGFLNVIKGEDDAVLKLAKLYNDLPLIYSLRLQVLILWINKLELESGLRLIWKTFSRAKKDAEDNIRQIGYAGRKDQVNVKHIEECLSHIELRLDEVILINIEDTDGYDALLEKFKTLQKPELKKAQEAVKRKFYAHWVEKGRIEMTFPEAKQFFEDTLVIGNSAMTNDAWKKLQVEIITKEQAWEVVELVRYGVFYDDAMKSWIAFGPTFEELFEAYNANDGQHTTSTPLQFALVSRASNYKQTSALFNSHRFYLREGWAGLVEKHAGFMPNLLEGIRNLGRTSLRASDDIANQARFVFIKRVLEFVRTTDEFEVVIDRLKSEGGDIHVEDESKVLLVQKAKKLLATAEQ